MANFLARPSGAIGAMLAIATAPLHLFLSKAHSEQFAAVLLAVIGAIYAGFALQKGNASQVAAEVAVATAFFAASLAALWVSPWIVPFAYAAHGIWDWAHHENARFAPSSWKLVAIPTWYPPFCAVYDWVAAASLAVIWSLRN